MIEGFMTKFDQVCDEICALRERVEALEALQRKPVAVTAASAPVATTPVTVTRPATRAADPGAKSAAK